MTAPLRRPLNMSRPVDIDRNRLLIGDVFDLTGFVPVADLGSVGYSFKGRALVGEANPEVVITPLGAGMVDLAFPVRFAQRPVFTWGFEYADNYSHDAGFPMVVAAVVAYHFGRRDETGLPVFEGARMRIAMGPKL